MDLEVLRQWLAPEGVVLLVETIPRHSQRISSLVDTSSLSQALVQRWHEAEERALQSSDDPRFNWQADTLETLLCQAGLTVQTSIDQLRTQVYLSATLLQRWFAVDRHPPSYRAQLAPYLSDKDLAALQTLCQRQLTGQTTTWRSTLAYLKSPPNRLE